MTGAIAITTGCRLHFGIFAHRPASGREFGGVGLMIDAPRVRLSLRADERDGASGPPEVAARVRAIVARYRAAVSGGQQPPPCSITIHESVPAHVGLGSGTQLALAVARGMARLAGDESADAVTLAARVGRGARSAIGIHGFERGGFLIDDGKSAGEPFGKLAARVDFPPDWRIVLVTPLEDAGLSGRAEREAFAQLPPMPSSTTAGLRSMAFDALLPSVTAGDFAAASESLHAFNRIVGEYFAAAQGGPYAHPRMRRLVEWLRAEGTAGVGQSSWGPTLFALARDGRAAAELALALEADPRWSACAVRVAGAWNGP
ncbi:MAG: hypothetical protein WD069_21700 [Planctomycetales bacterium]